MLSDDPTAAADPIARRVVVSGRVQGVFFRASTRREATRRGVHGWVRNRDDGRVEAYLEGPRAAVEAVESWMRSGGPASARVDGADATDHATEGIDDFRVRH